MQPPFTAKWWKNETNTIANKIGECECACNLHMGIGIYIYINIDEIL